MAETQKFLGKNQLLKRLTAQVGNEGTAKSILVKRGHMTEDGKLTKAGEARDNMTAAERAKDRTSKTTKAPKSQLVYDKATNRAVKRKK